MKKNKKIETEKVERFPRFRVLDAVIILLILVSVVGVYFRYNVLDILTGNRDMQEYTVSFSIEDIRYTTPNYINVDDPVYFADDGEQMGVLLEESADMSNIALSITPASKMFLKDDGTWVEVFYPNSETRISAKGRMLCQGRYTEDGGFFVNGSRYISAGQVLAVQTELVTVSITILNIELAETE